MATARVHPEPEAPSDLLQGLKDDPHASAAFAAMPPSHRRSYAEFIEESKSPDTRVRRVQQALRMIVQWGAEHPTKRATKKR